MKGFFFYADDSIAVLMAFQSHDLEILGLTTIFGNVSTEDATRNALLLVRVFPLILFFHSKLFSNSRRFMFLKHVHDLLLFLLCKTIV